MVMRFGTAAWMSKKSLCRVKINQRRGLIVINQRRRLRRRRWFWTFRLSGCYPGRPFACRWGGLRRARLQVALPGPRPLFVQQAWRRWPSGYSAQRRARACRGRSGRRSWYLQRLVPLLNWCQQNFGHLKYPEGTSPRNPITEYKKADRPLQLWAYHGRSKVTANVSCCLGNICCRFWTWCVWVGDACEAGVNGTRQRSKGRI